MPVPEQITQEQACRFFECSPSGQLRQDQVGFIGFLLCQLLLSSQALESEVESQVEQVTSSSLTVNGTVAAGAKSLDFKFSSDFSGTVAGVPYVGTADHSKSISATGNNTLGSIAVTVTAGTVYITRAALP